MASAHVTEEEEEEEDYVQFFDPLLFLCKNYSTVTYRFGEVTIDLRCLKAASTELELTGQIVWPAAECMAWFILAHPELFRDQCVVELGAGCGLAGLVMAHFARTTVLTDGNEVVLEVLEDNAQLLQRTLEQQGRAAKVRSLALEWDSEDSFAGLDSELAGEPIDTIIGADVVYWPGSIKPLLTTVMALFQRAPAGHTPRFYCAYVCRAVLTQRQLLDTAREMGFAVEDEPVAAFLPDGRHSIDATSLAGMHMYVLTLPPRAEQQPQGALHA